MGGYELMLGQAEVFSYVGAAGKTRCELAQVWSSPSKIPHTISVFTVPLSPPRRKVADLIAALATSGFGDQLNFSRSRGPAVDIEERRQPDAPVQFTRQSVMNRNGNPSTCISSTRYRNESMMRQNMRLRMFDYLPIPVIRYSNADRLPRR